MINLNNKISIDVNETAQRIIEQFVEDISDKLMINETYFGNLISVINGVFSLLIEYQPDTSVTISYYTDYQYITFVFTGVSRETSELLQTQPANLNIDNVATILTVHNLTEDIIVDDNRLSFVFDIEAMNSDMYNRRKALLIEYFQGNKFKNTIKSHDHLPF